MQPSRSRRAKCNRHATATRPPQVTRFASGCSKRQKVRRGDGRPPLPAPLLPYKRSRTGCWFFLARGSGVFVNIGRSLRRGTRQEVTSLLLGRRDLDDADDEWCDAAVRRGYDSVLVGTEGAGYTTHESELTRDAAELVVCSGACAREWSLDACSPLELRSGSRAQLPCHCDNRSAVLNCGQRWLRDARCLAYPVSKRLGPDRNERWRESVRRLMGSAEPGFYTPAHHIECTT